MAQPEKQARSNVKILSVVWFKVLPPKFGGQKAVALFNHHLAKHAPLICLCSKDNEATKAPYRIQASLPIGKSQIINPFVWRKIFRTAKSEAVTHLLLEFPYHGLAGMICQKLLSVRLIVNAHNIEYWRFKEQKKWWWGLLYHLERATMRRADAVFFKTADDLATAQKRFALEPQKLSVVPYGVEVKRGFNKVEAQTVIRKRHDIGAEEVILLFAGTLDYRPNAEAVTCIVEKLIPLLNRLSFSYKIIVCGRNHFKAFHYLNRAKNDRLIIVGEVDNIEDYFEAADVFMNPVLSGGGVQTKTMDALSFNLNVVCFDSKRTGIEHAGEKIFSVKDGDWQAFAGGVVKALVQNGHTPSEFFEKNSWQFLVGQAIHQLSRLVG